MRSAVLLFCFAATASAARLVNDANIVAAPLEEIEGKFKEFMVKFGKNHEGDEYHKRMAIFRDNLALAAENQKNDPTATHGVTQFSDLTPAEFRESLGLLPVPQEHLKKLRSTYAAAAPLPTNDLPENWDWREKGAVTPVKNQGACGSCWAFSTTGAIEGANFLKYGALNSLSEQQLVDCDHQCDPQEPQACDAGCNGGLPSNAMEYVIENGPLDTEESYPYNSFPGTCAPQKGTPAAHGGVSNFTIVSSDEDQMQAALVNNGPLSIGINANWMQTYTAGVSCPFLCSPQGLDHGVLIVGYGKAGFSLTRLHDVPYWIIKNSWGPTWGESGYIKVCRNQGKCGLNEMVVSAVAGA